MVSSEQRQEQKLSKLDGQGSDIRGHEWNIGKNLRNPSDCWIRVGWNAGGEGKLLVYIPEGGVMVIDRKLSQRLDTSSKKNN